MDAGRGASLYRLKVIVTEKAMRRNGSAVLSDKAQTQQSRLEQRGNGEATELEIAIARFDPANNSDWSGGTHEKPVEDLSHGLFFIRIFPGFAGTGWSVDFGGPGERSERGRDCRSSDPVAQPGWVGDSLGHIER